MKKFIMIALTILTIIPLAIFAATPALACIGGWSPGWFKNHTDLWAATTGTPFHPGDLYRVAFGFNTDPAPQAVPASLVGTYLGDNYNELTILGALELHKNKGYEGGDLAFLRQSAATLLNQGDVEREIAFLGRLVRTVYPGGGQFVDPGGWYNGTFYTGMGTYGQTWYTISDWASLWFDPLNSYY